MTAPNKQEFVDFDQHPALLWQVISAQAGTPEKAICELASNAFDADATEIRITITHDSFSVVDDGSGFGDRDNIMSVFKTFGLPHTESRSGGGRAKIGRFRAGRGQVMALSACTWRSGPFQMDVDLKPDEDADRPTEKVGFLLTQDLPNHPGCTVTGAWYRRLTPPQVEAIRRELREQLAYLDIPVSVNGVAVNTRPSEQTWTRETDQAWISARDTENLTVYNRGVYVARFPATRLGFGGMIISKVNLKLNIARNEISAGCPVWAAIREDVADLRREQRQTTGKMTHSQIQAFVQGLLDGSETIEADEISKLRLFEDMSGRKYTIAGLANLPALLIDDHLYDDRLGDPHHLDGYKKRHARTERMRRLTAAKAAIALLGPSFTMLSSVDGNTPGERLRHGLRRLGGAIERSIGVAPGGPVPGHLSNHPMLRIAHALKTQMIIDVDAFSVAAIEPVEDSTLGAHPRAMLEGARAASAIIASTLGRDQRTISASDTGDLEWSTPGHSTILIDKCLLVAVTSTTTRAISHLIYALTCAYTANRQCTSVDRDPELLEAFHHTAMHSKAGEFAMERVIRGYIQACAKFKVMPWKDALRAARRMGINTDFSPDDDTGAT